MPGKKSLEEQPPLSGVLKVAKFLGLDKYAKGEKNDTTYRRNIYNLVDPTSAYPESKLELVLLGNTVRTAKKEKSTSKNRDKNEPLAEAAWAKRLGLPYDTQYLIDNGDGSVRLNSAYESEIPVDTTFLKDRINANTKLREHYRSIGGLTPSRRQAIDLGIQYDQDALDSLRHTYKTGEPVSINEHSNRSRRWLRDGIASLDISPLSALQNYTIQYDKKNNRMNYSDVYDFNQFEDFVPGTPFNIKGSIKLK